MKTAADEMTPEEREERRAKLWAPMLEKFNELRSMKPYYGSISSGGLYDANLSYSKGTISLGREDGSADFYVVTVSLWHNGKIDVRVQGPMIDNKDEFWSEQLADRSDALVIGDRHYRVVESRPGQPKDSKGFGGMAHRLRVLETGEIIETDNLWFQGVIPPAWRDRLPPTAEYVR